MGKRKYENDNGDSTKKAKRGITVEVEDESEQPQIERNDDQDQHVLRGFNVKHFRKELATKQGQTMVLTQFLQVCLNPDNEVDYILEYLKCGGNSHEILRQITSDSKKNLSLATPAFHLFHLVILKVQSSLPHLIAITEEACRYFLNTFMSTVEIMISESSGPRHRKIILKLLTSMVTLNPDIGIEVLNQAPLTPKHLQHIVEKCNYKEKDNVRTCFVHFMTSFLVEGHLPLIKALLEKQGLLGLVVPGLIHDDAEAVLMFLNILKKNVIENSFVSKSLKLKMFSQQVLHNMFKIFSWKGPPDTENKTESRKEILSLLSEILEILFTNHKIGLYFIDSSLGMTDANKNPNLYKALLSLKRPWENEVECEVVLNIIYKCPDLHRAIISVIEQSFEPQHSPIWERATAFVIKLVSKLKPEELVSRMKQLSPPQIANFVRFVTMPVPLLKSIQANFGKDQTISIYCARVLSKMLQTLRRYMQILETSHNSNSITDLRNRLEYFLPKHMPAPGAIVALIDNVIAHNDKETTKDYALPKIGDTDALVSLIDLLLLYNDIHPTLFESLEGSIDMKKILDYSVTLDGNTALLKFKVISLWLTLDNSAVSLKNPMFKELFMIMLDVYMSEDNIAWAEAKDTLKIFFKNTGIFETDEVEVHLVLYTLRNSKVQPASLIGDIIVYILENIKELSEYIKSQLVNFEISDENSASSLEKLLEDLMENRNTEDNVFLENKVPSPFIVGCMQYLQLHKEVKKNLKPFLSLYVVNLLHSNYSPELTEVLIGDSKLEARNYVASWINTPIALPESIAGCDPILMNISKALIDDEDLSATDIFPFFEEATDDEDIVLNEFAYKLVFTRDVDSSELLIWAKYMIFCTVKLTDMGHLTPERQDKIIEYFHCLIAIGRKLHKVDVCRTILLNLFKNPHVLKIYKPIDLNKGEVSLLATKFLLQVVSDNNDIICYLDNKHKILKSFQQKNFHEIVKAFVKISKKKNVNCDHTILVLETVGLIHEDDMRVFNQIFSAEVSSCVKDDKEPSFILELLTHLIDKYAKSPTLELQQQILRKAMILYTQLLTSKDVNANLTKLEISLAEYLENKPHQVNKISNDLFTKFFEANTIRKTTSHLAYVLLKNNAKLCNVFKSQVARPEILSQRELTLPLGSGILNHQSFLLENRQLLMDIYNEYKSNINKLLEKPHKAGQVYLTNLQFVRKLVLECMDIEECGKLFTKGHKFETVELGHVQLLYSIFLKLCTTDKVTKDHLINYFLSMLHLTTIALKEGKDIQILREIITNIFRVAQISKNIKVLKTDELKKVTDSALWQNFCKAILKDSLKVKNAGEGVTIGPQLLCLLTQLVKLFYPQDHDDISSLFDMVTSHSEFLSVMLSHHSSEIKSRLIEFLYTLITMNKAVMKAQQIPVYLSSYHATRSSCDRLILAILYHYETSGLPVNEYKPYVWGDSGANYYAVRKNRSSSLWSHPTHNQVLNLFEKDIIERTVRNFPVTQKLEYHFELPSNIDELGGSIKNNIDCMCKDGAFKTVIKDSEGAVNNLALKGKYGEVIEDLMTKELVSVSHADGDERIYDPVFVFPLLSHLLAPGSAASCFRVLRSGLLALPVAALASQCERMRAAAYHVLHRYCMLLETETRHKNDKLFLTDFIQTLRHSLSSAQNNADNDTQRSDTKNPRLPAVDALYLAKGLMVSTAPSDPLYKPVNNFFIAKQMLDLTVVPDFLSLFHDADIETAERRLWILTIIKDGIKSMTDVNVVFKTMCLKMIMDYYSSTLSERKSKEMILEVVGSLVSVPRAFDIMVEGYGLMSWLHSAARQIHKDKSLAKSLLNVIKNMLHSMKLNAMRNMQQKNAKTDKRIDFIELKINKELEKDISVVLYESFRNLDDLDEDITLAYIEVYNSMSKWTIKSLTKNQVLSIINTTKIKDNCVDILIKAVRTSDSNMLKSKLFYCCNNNLFKELIVFVKSYLV